MPKKGSSTGLNESTSREQIIKENAELRASLEAEKQRSRVLSEELTLLKTKKLPEKEAHYPRLFDSLQEGFGVAEIIFDKNGKPCDFRILEANESFGRLTGFSPHMVTGKTARELLPELNPYWFDLFGRVALSNESKHFVTESKGLGKWFEVYAFSSEYGKFGFLFIDITERRQTEEALARQRELLQSIFDNIPIMLVMWDPRLQRFTLNHHAQTVLGWTTADANQGDFMNKVYPDAAYRAEIEAFMQSLETGWREWIVTAKDGRKVPVNWANIRLSDDTRIGIGVDLRERKQAEKALLDFEQRFRMAAKAAKIGAYAREVKTGRDYWSPEFLNIFGLNPEDTLPLQDGIPAAVHPEDRERVLAQARAHLEWSLGSDFSDEHRIILPGGETRWVMVRGRTEFDRQKRPVRTHGIAMDITDRKQTEEELRLARDEMEMRVEERTVQLRNRAEQLSRLSFELTMAEHRERQRLSHMLHDHLQQLLAAARMRLGTLITKIPEDQKEDARKINDLLSESIKSTRSLTRELSPPVLQKEGFTAALEWLADWMEQNHGLVVALKINTRAEIGGTEVGVLIFESIRELLFNIVKHADVSDAEIKLNPRDENFVQITVRDYGRGFDPDTIQNDSPTRTGFGLFSIQERLTSIGCEFRIDSAVGAGSTFTMVVPT